jgi:hypothetical protein
MIAVIKLDLTPIFIRSLFYPFIIPSELKPDPCINFDFNLAFRDWFASSEDGVIVGRMTCDSTQPAHGELFLFFCCVYVRARTALRLVCEYFSQGMKLLIFSSALELYKVV